jgi:hypothetical protein
MFGVGGLIGYTRSESNKISSSYVIVNIDTNTPTYNGLIIGSINATTDGSHANSTQIKAENIFDNIYFNDEKSTISLGSKTAIGVIASGADDIVDSQAILTDTEFSSHSTNSFTGFSTDVWTFDEGFYPYLQLQGSASDFNNPNNINDYVTP